MYLAFIFRLPPKLHKLRWYSVFFFAVMCMFVDATSMNQIQN